MEKVLLILIIFPSIVFSSLSSLSNTTSWIPELLVNPGIVNQLSCAGSCGLKVKNICYCDSQCEQFGDCCYDYWKQCTDSIYKNEDLMTAANALFDLNEVIESQYSTRVSFLDKSEKLVNSKNLNYYRGFETRVKASCSQANSDINSQACLTGDLSMPDTIPEKLLNAYYDKSTKTIYKNYYCGKCNQVTDANLVKMTYLKYCSTNVEDKIEKPSEITLEFILASGSPCKLLYNSPDTTALFRIDDNSQSDWNNCQIDDPNPYFTYSFANLRDTSSPYPASNELDAKLCELYILPVKAKNTDQYENLFFSEEIIFKNIHCMKYWFSTQNFGLRDFKADLGTDRSLFFIEKGPISKMRIELLYIADYSPSGKQYKLTWLVDTFNLHTMFYNIKNQISFVDSTVELPEKLFTELNQSTPGSNTFLDLYLMNQFYQKPLNGEEKINSYKFTLYFELAINTFIVYYEFSVEEWMTYMFDLTPLYKKAFQNYFINEMINRFELNRFMSDNYTLSVNKTSNIEYIAKVYIPLQFEVQNLEVLSVITANLLKILDSSMLHYNSIFERGAGDYAVIVNAELLNGIFTGDTENFIDSSNCQISPNIDIQSLVYTYTFGENSFYLSNVKVFSSLNTTKVHRLNSINTINSYNNESPFHECKYSYRVKSTLNSMILNIGYDTRYTFDIFSSSEDTNTRCVNGNKLFYFEDNYSALTFKDNVLSVAYKVFNEDTRYTIRIKDAIIIKYGNNIYFICLNKTDPVISKMEIANEHFRAKEANFTFMDASTDAASLLKSTGFSIYLIAFSIYFYYLHFN